MKKLVLSAAIFALSAGVAHAAPPSGSTSSAIGSATATVVAPLTITHNTGALAFGTFTAGTGGTVVVDSAGTGSATGDVGFVSGSANSADSFTVSGSGNRNFNITATGGSVTSGTDTMAFTVSVPASASLSGGTYSLPVGGELTVGSAQAPGAYTGSYTVTVSYQ